MADKKGYDTTIIPKAPLDNLSAPVSKLLNQIGRLGIIGDNIFFLASSYLGQFKQ